MVVKSANRTLIETGPADLAGRAQPGGGPLGQPQQLAGDDGRVVDVGREGLLGADALVRLGGHDHALVAPPGQRGQVRPGGRAERALQGRHRGGGQVADGVQPEPRQHVGGLVPHPPQRPDRQRVQEGHDVGGRDDEQPVGLAPRRGQLGDELGGGDAHRAGDALLVLDGGADPLADLRRRAEPALRAADVQERLVERDRLDQRGDRAEHGHDAVGGPGVGAPSGGSTVACGHSRRARIIGIALRTP
jgi:hypothetical protein